MMAASSQALDRLNQAFEKAVNDGVIPGGVAFARNTTSSLNYSKAFGKRSLAKGSDESMELDTVFSIASCTKLITSIAALQVVERGLIGLDDDLADIVPLLGKQQVLHGLDDAGEPVLKDRKNPFTLRQLLTHSAGAAYSVANPTLDVWRAKQGLGVGKGATFEERIAQPLMYEPGMSWEYGTNIDWAGRVVENLTGQSLEDYFHENIFKPLEIKDITFFPHKRPEMEARKAKMTLRAGAHDSPVIDYNGPYITDGAVDCFGGHGGYADLSHYIEILNSILLDDERLLKKTTTADMFKPQLVADKSKSVLSEAMGGSPDSWFIGEFPNTKDYNWGLAGLLIGGDHPGWRSKGRMIWSGLPNLFWFIDREVGICGIFGTQVMPPGDAPIKKVLTIFEKAIWEENATLQKQTTKL